MPKSTDMNMHTSVPTQLSAPGSRTVHRLTAPLVPITRREIEVLQAITDGCSTPEIAQRLYLSQKTVKNHLASIYQKLHARDRTQAVLAALRMGLVTLDATNTEPESRAA